jgi:predicted RNA methylase
MKLFGRLSGSFARRGLVGTLRHAVARVIGYLRNQSPAARRDRAEKRERDRAFDERFGVDTGGIIDLSDLGIDVEHRSVGSPYWASEPELFLELIRNVGVHYPAYTFVDIGCGKGRALLLASEFPFKSVVGVELSDILVQSAKENLRRYPAERRRCAAVEVHCMDASLYDIPSGPLLLYFFHPFGESVLTKVVQRIVASYEASPRDIRVIYSVPLMDHVWATVKFLEKSTAPSGCSIYATRSSA